MVQFIRNITSIKLISCSILILYDQNIENLLKTSYSHHLQPKPSSFSMIFSKIRYSPESYTRFSQWFHFIEKIYCIFVQFSLHFFSFHRILLPSSSFRTKKQNEQTKTRRINMKKKCGLNVVRHHCDKVEPQSDTLKSFS